MNFTFTGVSVAAQQANSKPVQHAQPWNANKEYVASLFSAQRRCSTGLVMKQTDVFLP